MILASFAAFLAAIAYNSLLAMHLYKEKVSNGPLHEEYIKKKEIEYVVGISEMWNSRHFYVFSSFKGDVFKMYHRVIFNVFEMLLMVVHGALVSKIRLIILVRRNSKDWDSSRPYYSFGLLHYCCSTLQMLIL